MATPDGAKLTYLHKALQTQLASQSMAATKLLWKSMEPAKGAAAMEKWLRSQVALSGVFDAKSAALAADYVKKFRIAEGFPDGPIVGVQEFDENWAKESMSYNGSNKVQAFMDQGMTAEAALAKAAPYAMAAAQRLTLGGGRRVVDKSALANPESTGWRRVSSGGACAFCAMLVSRGPEYKSEKSAGAGRAYHHKCACTVEEVFGDWEPTPKEKEYQDAYNTARKDITASGEKPNTANILEHMRASGKFTDSPKPPAPKYTAPVPHPTLGPSYRVSYSGQVWKGYKYKVHGVEGTSWKKVNPDGSVLPENKTLPSKKQLEAQAKEAAEKAAAAAKAAEEAAAAAAKEAAEKAAKEAAEAAKAKVLDKLGPGFRIGSDGTIWKGYKYKIQGKEGMSWKKVDETGKRINVDPPTKKQVAAAEAKKAADAAAVKAQTAKATAAKASPVDAEDVWKPPPGAKSMKSDAPKTLTKYAPEFEDLKPVDGLASYAYKKDSQGNIYKADSSGKIWTKTEPKPPNGATYSLNTNEWYDKFGNKISTAPKTPAVHVDAPPVVLKNEYQKKTAAAYGWGQPELQAWVKSGKTMEAYKASLTPGGSPILSTKPGPKITAAPGKGGTAWASSHWPGASRYTAAEQRGFSSYTGSGYTTTNSTLRSSKGVKGANAGLETAFKRPTSVVPNDTVAYRGVRSAKALGLTTDSGDLSKLVGSEYVEHGYMSTAVEGSGFGGSINMTVKIPKGHRAVYVSQRGDPLSQFGESEKELLLDRGTRFKIVEATKTTSYSGDKWNVVVEVIPPPIRPAGQQL